MVKKLQRHRKDRASAPRARASNVIPTVIDIFHKDAVRSFARVRQSGIRGVIHKATEGRTVPNPAYARRRLKARDAGLRWSTYHFMRPGDPVVRANYFIDKAKLDPRTLVAIDHEDGRVPPAKVTGSPDRDGRPLGAPVAPAVSRRRDKLQLAFRPWGQNKFDVDSYADAAD